MKTNSLMLVATALLILPAARTLAAEDGAMRGSVELGVQFADGEDEGAKFQEYRDLEDGIYGNFFLDYYKDSNFFQAEGENAGLENQFYQIRGGRYGTFKYSLFFDEIPHNLTFGARSFYSGIGTGNLSIDTLSPANQATWRNFDYQIDTTRYGGDIEFSLASPYYLKFGANRNEKEGLKPLGTGSFSGAVELPEPVDYATDNFTLEGGYTSETVSFNVSGLYSTFNNDDNFLSWQNPFLGITEHNSLPPDNDYAKIGANLIWRQLPGMSTLTVNGSYTNLTNDFSVFEIGASLPPGLNQTSFEGEISTARIGASYVSHPVDTLDTRLFYEYFDRDNDSTVIEYDDGGNAPHLFEYSKHTAGLDVDYDLAADTRLGAGYLFEDVDRSNRPDASSNTDNQLFIKLKNTSLDYLTPRIEYTYLNRDTDTDFNLTGLTVADAEFIVQYVKRFDVASKSRNALEFALDIFPVDYLDLGLSYTYVNNDYDDVTLGRTEDTGHEIYVDFMWRAARIFNLSGFAGYESYEADSNHYNFASPQPADPTFVDNSPASFLWTQSVDEDFWTVGLAAQMPLLQDRLKLSLAWQYQDSDGTSDFTSQGTSALLPINAYDDYYITTVEAKAAYALTDALDLSLGYLYEKSSYEDLQYEGYEYDRPGTYLSGANSDFDYEAHVGFVALQFKF